MRRTSPGWLIVTALALASGCTRHSSSSRPAPATGGHAVNTPNPLVPSRNTSDPQVRVFDDRLYLYTSADLGVSGTWSNPYPMNATSVYSVGPGSASAAPSAWDDGGAVLRESQYAWVPAGANHLWAPDCNRMGGTYYLYVPDVTDADDALSSKIGVSTGSSPTGPFTPQGTLAITGYASDPSTFIDADGKAYLVFADGDYSTCGGLSIARLGADMISLATAPQPVSISGLPRSSVGQCADKDHPYLEGAGLDHFGADGKNQYFLYFAMKPDDQNEVIAYATAPAPLGPYTYRGIIMNGSATEWTNQASIVRWGSRWLFFYHDGPSGTHARKVRAECLRFEPDGSIQPITRTSAGLSACTEPPG
jgi:hypothetical protein